MSSMTGLGFAAAPVRHGEVRYHASAVKQLQAAHAENRNANPTKVVTETESSAADNDLGKIVDMKT